MAFTLASNAATVTVPSHGEGIWRYGPDVSENYACGKAENLAKVDAVRKVLGENIFYDEFKQCVERNGEVKCEMENAIYSATEASIKTVKNSSRAIGVEYGQKLCKVQIDVEVTNERPKFDAYVDGRFFYRSGEEMKWKVSTNTPTKLYAFHVEGKRAKMIWPTYVGTNHDVSNELLFPTAGYRLIARASKNTLDESIVFVLTTNDQKFMRDYNMEDLNTKLMSIPISERRIVRRNLVIEQ